MWLVGETAGKDEHLIESTQVQNIRLYIRKAL